MRLKGTAFPGGFKAADKSRPRPRSVFKEMPNSRREKPRRARAKIGPTPRWARENKGAKVEATHIAAKHSGTVMLKDWTPSGTRMSGVIFGTTGPQGGISSNPAHVFSRWVRRRLAATKYKRPDCTVYDKDGKPIAIIDGDSRERRPLP